MKKNKSLSIIVFLLFLFLFLSCQKNKNTCDFVIADGTIKSPKWLVAVADSLEKLYRPGYFTWDQSKDISVHSIHYQEKDYILVQDYSASTFSQGLLFFSCSGKKIEQNSALWLALLDQFLQCGIKVVDEVIRSPQWLIHTIDSLANIDKVLNEDPLIFDLHSGFVVHLINHQEEDYLLVVQYYHITYGDFVYFTCSGEKVDDTDLCAVLFRKYCKLNSVKLWWGWGIN